jgi:hypothetical protein
MPRRGRIAALVLVALTCGADRAQAGGLEPVRGSVRVGPEATDPGDGGQWTVRSWRPRRGDPHASPRQPIRCLQVGRPDGARIVRTVRGRVRTLGWRDRTVCGPVARGAESPPLLVERLLGDVAVAPLQTIVAGVLRRADTRVQLEVAGVARQLPVARRGRAFLAVLPGAVKRSELGVEYSGESDTRRIELNRGDGYYSLAPGTVRRGLTMPALGGGPDLALTTFQLDQPRGPRVTCIEPGRAVAGEAGQYDPRWDVFLEAPTLAAVNDFEDGEPSLAPPGSSGACIDEAGVEEHTAVRTAAGAVAVSGVVGPGVTAVQVAGRDGAAVPVAIGTGALRPFVAQVPSTGAFGERTAVAFVHTDGRSERSVVWLGRHDVPTAFSAYEPHRGGVRISWLGGVQPPGRLTVREDAHRVRIRLTERLAPTFTDDGVGIVYPAIGIIRCVDVDLRRPLGERRVVDATSGRTVRRVEVRPGRGCRLSRPRG